MASAHNSFAWSSRGLSSRFSPNRLYFLVLWGVKESEAIDMDNTTTLGPMSKSSTNLGAIAKSRILLDLREERRP